MRIAIVGSRTYPFMHKVVNYVQHLPKNTVVVSGGARGVDDCAERVAKACGLECSIHLPNLEGAHGMFGIALRYHARNQKVVDDCDSVVAFTQKSTGGTWDTIRRARKAGKPVELIN